MINQISFFVFLISLSSLAAAKTSTYLARGSSVSVKSATSDILISPDRAFTCGFYGSGANAYWFAIWFTNSIEKTVVWMANRDNPINGRGSRLTLQKDGVLALIDFDGSVAWKTNTTSTDVVKAELLNSGNLVLKDPIGKVLWQSFDFPTDTLLPNQPFTMTKTLISNIAAQYFTSGHYRFLFDNNNVLTMIYDGPEISSIYWPDPDNTVLDNGRTSYNGSRFAILDEMGSFLSSDRLLFSASDMGSGIKRRLTMDHDGNLRLYSLNGLSGSWVITWQAMSKLCDVHGLCGKNGICVYAPEPKCSCPPHYEPSDLTDWSKGCKPKFSRSCSDSGFVEVPHANFYGFILNSTKKVSLNDCKKLCLGDCNCQAFRYKTRGHGKCYTKGSLFNGYMAKGSLYLRIPARLQKLELTVVNVSNLECGKGKPKVVVLSHAYETMKQTVKWVCFYGFLSVLGVIEVAIALAGWCFLFRKHGLPASLEDGYRAISSQFRSFTYSELKTTTGKFKELLGRGGFGAVYKGVLADERVVAVKKLENVVQGEEEFWAEVSTFGCIYHINLARMWGFCSEKKHRLLVYEYVENGSLDKHLFSSGPTNNGFLGWKERFKIALGTAKGLAYLHHECLEWVIHCDVKPENILLDINFEPKISDFGLAKLCQRGGHGTSTMSKIRGTKGYMAPEWTTNLPITAKVDVYSYGVVILELVRGIRLSNRVVNDDIGEEDEEEEVIELKRFVRLAKRRIENGEEELWIEAFVDPRLEGKYNRNQVVEIIKVGLSCVAEDRNKRPTMELVAQLLSDCEDEST